MANATDSATAAITEIKLVDAAPGTARIHGRNLTVLRGTLEPRYFKAIQTPRYQRELMMGTGKHEALIQALGPDGIGVPDDLLLACRVANFTSLSAGELLVPTGELFTLDGLQRVGAALARLAQGWRTDSFGVKILLGTFERLERDLFYQVNRLQTKVSTDVHMGNSDDNAACNSLRNMANTADGFPEVKWKQQRGSGEKITAHMLYEIATMVHGYPQNRPFEGILDALEALTKSVGTKRLTDNTQIFFDVVRQCFDGTDVQQYRWRVGMLRGLAQLFSRYQNFWSGDQLMVRKPDIKKLSTIKWTEVAEALSQNNSAVAIRRTLETHFEKGRHSEKGGGGLYLQPRERS